MSEIVDGNGNSARTPKHLTSAGRLLRAVADNGAIELPRLARHLNVSARLLQACLDGERPLEIELQIMLAALVLELAPHPQLAPLARRLHAQAQSALRVREGAVSSQATYPGRPW